MAILQDLIVSVRNLRAELKVEPKVKVPIEVFAHEPAIRTMIEQNRGAVERLANVEKITFVESSLAKVAGARSTARFDVHVVYERKIDVAAECERLKKELEKIGQGHRQRTAATWATSSFWRRLRRMWWRICGSSSWRLAVLKEKTVSKLKELGCI